MLKNVMTFRKRFSWFSISECIVIVQVVLLLWFLAVEPLLNMDEPFFASIIYP